MKLHLRLWLCTMLILSGHVLLYADSSSDIETGRQLFALKKYTDAETYFNRLYEKDPHNAEVAYNLGKSAIAAGDYEKAVAALENACHRIPGNADYQFALGLAYARRVNEVSLFKKLGVSKKMLAAFQQAVELDQHHVDARLSLISYYLTAPKIAGGSVEEAEQQLKILKAQHPEKTFWVASGLLERQKKYDAAEKVLRQLLRADSSPLNLINLAGFYMRREQYDAAIPLIDRFLTMDPGWLDPRKSGAYFMLGIIYEKKQMAQKAKESFALAMQHHPDKWMVKEIQKRK